jgi:hypothetical protein
VSSSARILWLWFTFGAISLPLAACSTAGNRPAVGAGAEAHNVIDCSIYGMDGQSIRRFPGTMCAFLPDGRVASAQDGLSMLDTEGKLLWHRDWQVHHQLNLDESKTHLLGLSKDQALFGKNLVTYDVAMVIGLDGEIIHRFSFFEHLRELEAAFPSLVAQTERLGTGQIPAYKGFEHATSIYEIPENPYAKVNPAFRAGNYVINVIAPLWAVLVVDHEMNRVLWSVSARDLGAVQLNDVQVLPNGHLLFFSNDGPGTHGDERDHGCCSSLVEYDLMKRAQAWTWSDPKGRFFAPHRGGVQALSSGSILFNGGPLGFARELTRDGKPVWEMENLDTRAGRPVSFQQIKRYDLSSFLERNHFQESVNRADAESHSRPRSDVLWGFLDPGADGTATFSGGAVTKVASDESPAPPLELAGLSVRVDGDPAPVFFVDDSYFAVLIPHSKAGPARTKSCEVYFRGSLTARMTMGPHAIYPGIYVADFARVAVGLSTR